MRARVTLLALCLGMAAPACAKKDKDGAGAGAAAPGAACTTDCLAIPMGIKGLSFGMTMDEATDALGGAKLRPASAHKVFPSERSKANVSLKVRRDAWRAATRTVPGTVVRVDTTLGTEAARCMLAFAVDSKLSSIDCSIEGKGMRRKRKYAAVFGAIRTRLVQRHGAGKDSGSVVRWADDNAVLVLTGQPSGRGKVGLLNQSAKHGALVATLQRGAEDRYALLIDKALQAKEDAKRDRDLKRKETGRVWDRDLSGAPESPR